MRNLVIETICQQFLHGLDEFHVWSDSSETETFMEFVREMDGKYYGKRKVRFKFLSEDGGLIKFEKLLKKLSNENLLQCLDGQACQQYR